MEQTIQTQEVLAARKAFYEKPTSQVYELEVEGAVLQASTDDPKVADYEYDKRGRWE